MMKIAWQGTGHMARKESRNDERIKRGWTSSQSPQNPWKDSPGRGEMGE